MRRVMVARPGTDNDVVQLRGWKVVLMVVNGIGFGKQDEDICIRLFCQFLGLSGREATECASSSVAVRV